MISKTDTGPSCIWHLGTGHSCTVVPA